MLCPIIRYDPIVDMLPARSDYPASWNVATRLVTGVGMAGAIGYAAWSLFRSGSALVVSGMAVVVILAFLFAPRSYSLAPGRLLLHRPIGAKEIPLKSIEAASRIRGPELGGCVMLWGSGGLFGVFGRVYSDRVGTHRWYASRSSDLVVLKTPRSVLVISPDRPDEFVSELQSRTAANG